MISPRMRSLAAGWSCASRSAAIASAMHVLMNPPFHDEISQQASPDPERALAHVASSTTLAAWITTAAWMLRPRGTLTLIWRADGLLDVLSTLAKAFGGTAVLPV